MSSSLELNKAVAAVLTAGITFMVAGIVGRMVVHPHRLEKPAIAIDTGAPAPGAGAPAAPAGPEPIEALLASADVARGEQIAKRQCGACHTFTDGGRNGVGPNLYNIVGSPHGHIDGFSYSNALKGKEGPWNYDELNHWLFKPNTYAPGTRMAYAGLSNTQQRADLIAFLRSLSADPKPLP